MTVNLIDFDVAVAAFEAILYQENLWLDYFLLFREEHQNVSRTQTYTEWKMWAKKRQKEKWLSQAFFWDNERIPYTKWIELDEKWLKWITDNLKK